MMLKFIISVIKERNIPIVTFKGFEMFLMLYKQVIRNKIESTDNFLFGLKSLFERVIDLAYFFSFNSFKDPY